MKDAGKSLAPREIPYPGLRAFSRREFHIFFGRDQHISEMIAKLSKHWFLCVTGPSGCGKSSLARTGLFNALEAGFLGGRGSDWIFCDLHPETDPIERLCSALATAIVLGESGRNTPEPDEAQAEQVDQLTNLFRNHINSRSSDLTGALANIPMIAGRPIVILVDQFEEIFRFSQKEPQAASLFVDVLLKTAAARQDVYIVITIRTDELEKCARYSGLTSAINSGQFLTPTLDRFQMQEAIEGPAELFNAEVESALAVWMLNGLEEQLDKLPLMQHALRLLYLRARETTPEGPVRLTRDMFFEVFGLKRTGNAGDFSGQVALRGSLSQRLDAIYDGLSEPQKLIARRLFCALTTLESHGRDIRRPVKLGDAAEAIGCSFDELLAVITVFKNGDESYLRIAGEHDGIDPGDTVDVTHECILRLWCSLQDTWLKDENKSADNIRQLGERARDREPLTGNKLKSLEEWWSSRKFNAAWASRYLEGVKWEEDGLPLPADKKFSRIAKLMRTSRIRASIFKYGGGFLALCLLTLVGIVFDYFAGQAERRTREMSLSITAINPSETNHFPVPTAEQAADLLDSTLTEKMPTDVITLATLKLLQSTDYISELRRFDHDRGVRGAEFLPGGEQIVTLTERLGLAVWNRENNAKPLLEIPPEQITTESLERSGRSLAVAPDGTIAIGTKRGAVLLAKDVGVQGKEPQFSALLPSPGNGKGDDDIISVTFSSDGRRLAAGALNGLFHLWTRAADDGLWGNHRMFAVLASSKTGDSPFQLISSSTPAEPIFQVWSVALSPTSEIAAAGLANGMVCTFAVNDGKGFCSDEAHRGAVRTLDFSPSGQTLLSGGTDDRLRIWTARNVAERSTNGKSAPNAMPFSLSEMVLWHESNLWSVDFDPIGGLAASASWDGTVRVFETGTWRLLRILRGHKEALRSVRFAPDGPELLTASLNDRTARLWTPFSTRLSDRDLDLRLPWTGKLAPALKSTAMGSNSAWIAFLTAGSVWLRTRGEQPLLLFPGVRDSGRPASLASARDRDLLALALQQPEVRIWSRNEDGVRRTRRMSLEATWPLRKDDNRTIAVSADGNRLAVEITEAGENAILVCATDAARCGTEAGAHIAKLAYPARIEDGRKPEEDANGCIRNAELLALALAPNGDRLAAGGSDCNIRLYDLTAPDRPPQIMSEHVGNIDSLDFSANGEAVASASADWRGSIWRPASNQVQMLGGSSDTPGHKSALTAIRMHPSGQFAATASRDEQVIVWDTQTGKSVVAYTAFTSSLNTLDVGTAPSGMLIVTGSDDGEVSTRQFFDSPEGVAAYADETLANILGPLR